MKIFRSKPKLMYQSNTECVDFTSEFRWQSFWHFTNFLWTSQINFKMSQIKVSPVVHGILGTPPHTEMSFVKNYIETQNPFRQLRCYATERDRNMTNIWLHRTLPIWRVKFVVHCVKGKRTKRRRRCTWSCTRLMGWALPKPLRCSSMVVRMIILPPASLPRTASLPNLR